MKRIQKLQNDVKKWSDETFGDNRTGLPIAHHLKKETDEVIEAIKEYHKGPIVIRLNGSLNVSANMYQSTRDRIRYELADCLTLLVDVAAHEGINMEDLLDACEKKLEINKKRKWGAPDENGVVEHIHE